MRQSWEPPPIDVDSCRARIGLLVRRKCDAVWRRARCGHGMREPQRARGRARGSSGAGVSAGPPETPACQKGQRSLCPASRVGRCSYSSSEGHVSRGSSARRRRSVSYPAGARLARRVVRGGSQSAVVTAGRTRRSLEARASGPAAPRATCSVRVGRAWSSG